MDRRTGKTRCRVHVQHDCDLGRLTPAEVSVEIVKLVVACAALYVFVVALFSLGA